MSDIQITVNDSIGFMAFLCGLQILKISETGEVMFMVILKTYRRYWAVMLAVLGCTVFMVPSTAFAQPTPPHLFIGEEGAVTKDSKTVLSGTITAWIDGEQVASAPVLNGAYSIFVVSPDGSSYCGKQVTFKVDGDPTNTYGVWEQGGADVLPHQVMPAPVSSPTMVPTETPVPAATSVPPADSAVPGQQNNKGFRENPTTRIRPVQDEITSDQDGIIEAIMVNPSVNDVPLSVDMVITVPTGVHVYGDGFACAGTGAGACAGSFTILPGQSKTAVVNIKGDKVGSHQVHFSGYWWPGENKDMRQPISLTHPFNVIAPSKDLTPPKQGDTRVTVETNNTKIKIDESQPSNDQAPKGNDGGCGLASGDSIPLGSIGLFLGVGLMGFRGMFGNLF